MARAGGVGNGARRRPRAVLAARLWALSLAATTTVAVPTAAGAETAPLVRVEAPIIVEADDPSIDVDDPALVAEMEAVHRSFDRGSRLVVPGEAVSGFQRASVGTGMTVAFDATHTAPGAAQAVVLAATADWDQAVLTTAAGPVEVAVIWKDLGSPSLLGSAGPNGLFAGGGLPAGAFHPAPLANTLLGYDVNGPGSPELTINLNSTANWYIGTGGSPGSGQIDLYSVVLHELGHGLGFLGSASVYNHLPHSEPTLEETPFVFDQLVSLGGSPLLSDPDPDAHLRSGALHLATSDVTTQKLYAPATWTEGSSFSHFDEATHPPGQPGALMTPSLGSAETERQLDAATLGVMTRIGWPMRTAAATPTISSTAPAPGAVGVTWSLDLLQAAPAPDSYRVEARQGSTVVSSVAVPATTTSTTVYGLVNGETYTVAVVPVARGLDGPAATGSVTLQLAAPRAVTVAGSGLDRTVTWLAPEGSGVTSYDVEQSTDGGPWVPLGSTAGLGYPVSVTEGLHQFRVRGRDGTGPGLWGYSIPTGIAAGIVRPLPLDGEVSRLYQAYFLRPPDPAGFDFWVSQRAAGLDLGAVAEAFASSTEFQAAYGALDDTAFVDLVYQNVLGRSPDPGGGQYWTGVLAGGASRGEVMTGFSESAEFVASTGTAAPQSVHDGEVYRLYVSFFLRVPDETGLAYWLSVRESGTSLTDMAAAFAASPEFQATYGSLPDDDFVELVYYNVLARAPDGGGLAYWLGLLAAGTDRGTLMTGFSESAEFVVATGTTP